MELIFKEEGLKKDYINLIKRRLGMVVSADDIVVDYAMTENNTIMATLTIKIDGKDYLMHYLDENEQRIRAEKGRKGHFRDKCVSLGIDPEMDMEEIKAFGKLIITNLQKISPEDYVWLCCELFRIADSFEDDTIDCFRVCSEDDQISVRTYQSIKNSGCCKRSDRVLKSPHTNRIYFFGLNYGHQI